MPHKTLTMTFPARWHSDRTFESAPYHLCGSPEEVAEPFVLYITNKFGREEFQDEVEDFGNVFGHRTAFVARFCMATAVYFKIAWVRGYRWVLRGLLVVVGQCNTQVRLSLIYVLGQPPRPPVPGIL